jgi:predicted nucleic acid-binding protein
MMVSFDTNILVYATLSVPLAKTHRARDLLVRGIGVDEVRTTIDAWRAVLPVQGTEDDDLSAALDAVKKHRLAFWDAMLWAEQHGPSISQRLPGSFMPATAPPLPISPRGLAGWL